MFLHGWCATPSSYTGALAAWESLGFDVWAPTLPGHGSVPALPGRSHSVAGLAEWVVLQGVVPSTGPVVFAGHSLGGAIATVLCDWWRSQSSVNRSLLLLSPAGAGGRFGPREWLRAAGDQRKSELNRRETFQAWWSGPLRAPLRTARLGLEARTCDITREWSRLTADGVQVTAVHALSDVVLDTRAVLDVPGVRSVTVAEHHSWPTWRPDLARVVMEEHRSQLSGV